MNGDISQVVERYRERWFLHAYVDENERVTNIRYGKSTKNRRRRDLSAAYMTKLSVSNKFIKGLNFTEIFSGPLRRLTFEPVVIAVDNCIIILFLEANVIYSNSPPFFPSATSDCPPAYSGTFKGV